MRKIKFRGKRVEDSELIFGYYVFTHDSNRIIYEDYEGFYCEEEVIPESVGQYTGLKDKNGREIYEGDILKIDDDWEKWGFASGFVGYVIYDQGSFKLKEGEIYDPAYRLDSAAEEGTTVIGNVYENPELLEEK